MSAAKRTFRRLGGLLGSLIFLGALCIPSAGVAVAAAAPAPQLNGLTPPSTPIQAKLEISATPGVGQPATLTCTVTSTEDASGVNVNLEVPQGTQVTGDLSWTGDLVAGEPVILAPTISFDTPGDKALYCRALGAERPDGRLGDLAPLYLNVGADSGAPGYAPVPAEKRMIQALPKNADAAAAPSGDLLVPADFQPPELPAGAPPEAEGAAPANPAGPGAAYGPMVVSGSWSQYDRDGAYVPAYEMTAELVIDDASWTHLDYQRTDLTGHYTFASVTNPGATGVRVLLWADTVYSGDILNVFDPDYGATPSWSNIWAAVTPKLVLGDGAQDVGDWYPSTGGTTWYQAFWIQSDLIKAYRYVWFQAGDAESSGPASVQWKPDSTDGNYYNFGGTIHLDGPAPISDTVVNHEYGHTVMYTIYGNTFPPTSCPAPHYLTNNEDRGCAWTEGWASFLAFAVKNEPVYRWSSGAYQDVDAPTWGTPGWDTGDDVEGHVSGGLWDMLDSGTEGWDKYSEGTITNIWEIMYHQNDDVMSDFWSAWQAYGHNYPGAIMSLYQSTIDYRAYPILRGDFEGNHAAELSVWRPTNATWYIKDLYNTAWGTNGDIPVPGDYNGDRFGEPAVWRESNGTWYIKGVGNYLWGQSGDQPIQGDYDGDGMQEMAVFRPSNHTWYIKNVGTYSWGASGDVPVPGDYDDDGTTEIAVWRPSNGVWYIKGVGNYTWGQSGDLPVPGDYNGLGGTEVAIWRPSNGIWYVRNYENSQWGTVGDIPVPGDYDGDVHTEYAVWRPSTGMWYVKNHFATVWGSTGDFPVTAPQWYFPTITSPNQLSQ